MVRDGHRDGRIALQDIGFETFRILDQTRRDDILKLIFARIKVSPIEYKLVHTNIFQVATAHSSLDCRVNSKAYADWTLLTSATKSL